MSVGIITSYLAPSFLPELPSFLFGNILTITFSDILVLLVLTVMTVAFFALFLPQIIAVAFDYDFAVSQHIRAGLIDAVMTALVALTVVACLKVVGIIMVIAMLSVPQVTANIFSCSFRGMVLLSALISIFNCMLGFVISYLLDVPCGASIILVSVFIYVLSKAIMGTVLALK
jgi:zinc transport system permease protein